MTCFLRKMFFVFNFVLYDSFLIIKGYIWFQKPLQKENNCSRHDSAPCGILDWL